MKPRPERDWATLYRNAPLGKAIPGDPELIIEQAQDIHRYLTTEKIVNNGDRVLDFGCGIGRMAIPLSGMDILYEGIDVMEDCILFCREAFNNWTNFVFRVLNVRNEKYRPKGFWSARRLRLPYADASFDAVLAISVFTHIGDRVARDRAIREIFRVLKPGGRAYVTWFKSPPNAPDAGDERSVFPEEEIRTALSAFEIKDEAGGTTIDHHDQWALHLRKPVTSPTPPLSSPETSSRTIRRTS